MCTEVVCKMTELESDDFMHFRKQMLVDTQD